MTIVTIGGIAIDTILETPELPSAGRCVVATSAYQGLGGKAANQAVAAARLGGRVAVVGAVGDDDFGDYAIRRLRQEGVSTDPIRRERGMATGAVVIQRDGEGRKQAAVFPGANARMTRDAVDTAGPAIAAARVVTVQLEIPLDAARHAIELAGSAGAIVILDPSPARPLPREAIAASDVVRANAAEARVLTGIEVRDLDSGRAAAQWLLDAGARLAVVEVGEAGNLFRSDAEEVVVPLLEVGLVDRTGAGDALAGALAVALAEDMPLRRAAAFAVTVAALTTRSLGSQPAMPRRAEVERLL